MVAKAIIITIMTMIIALMCSTGVDAWAASIRATNTNAATDATDATGAIHALDVRGIREVKGAGGDIAKMQRRQFLTSVAASAAGCCLLMPQPSSAATATSAAEAIRRSAASLPNYGQTDVFYPSSVVGSWRATRQVEFAASGKSFVLHYPFRFIQSIEDNAVVADRGINQLELEQALIRTVTGRPDEQPVRSSTWEVTNPNDLKLVLSDGSIKDIKVTKRATEKTDVTVSSSEFQRITQESAARGIPTISARRIVTKWKILDDSTMEGLEIVYDVGGGDPLAGAQISSQPTVLSKSRISLTR